MVRTQSNYQSYLYSSIIKLAIIIIPFIAEGFINPCLSNPLPPPSIEVSFNPIAENAKYSSYSTQQNNQPIRISSSFFSQWLLSPIDQIANEQISIILKIYNTKKDSLTSLILPIILSSSPKEEYLYI